jgi:hypothetical protein
MNEQNNIRVKGLNQCSFGSYVDFALIDLAARPGACYLKHSNNILPQIILNHE